jgi:hypothetical protein
MKATRQDLLETLKDVILSDERGAEAIGHRLAEGLTTLALSFPDDRDLDALAFAARENTVEPTEPTLDDLAFKEWCIRQ